jgi:chromosome segregation ATPase
MAAVMKENASLKQETIEMCSAISLSKLETKTNNDKYNKLKFEYNKLKITAINYKAKYNKAVKEKNIIQDKHLKLTEQMKENRENLKNQNSGNDNGNQQLTKSISDLMNLEIETENSSEEQSQLIMTQIRVQMNKIQQLENQISFMQLEKLDAQISNSHSGENELKSDLHKAKQENNRLQKRIQQIELELKASANAKKKINNNNNNNTNITQDNKQQVLDFRHKLHQQRLEIGAGRNWHGISI